LPRFGGIANKLVSLTYEGLSQLKTKHSGIKPVKICPAIPGLVDKDIEKLIFTTTLVTKDKLLFSFFKNELLAYLVHDDFIPLIFKNIGTTFPLSLSVVIRNT